MYATGYRVDFSNGTLKQTGVIAVTSKPSGATITINDRLYSRKTPFTLRNVLPGTYHLKLEMEGYRTYEKDIEVTSSQVTEEHNIDLVLVDISEELVAERVEALIGVNGETYYFDTDKQFIKLGDPSTVLTFDRLPDNVRSVLSHASSIYLAQQFNSHWVLGVVSNGRRWLTIIEPLGYRGYIFGSPLNQVTHNDIFRISSDRLMFIVGSSLYTLDLNLNRLNLYIQGVSGATYAYGSAYYTIRNQGRSLLMQDTNLFDGQSAKELANSVPVGQRHEITATSEGDIIIIATNRGVRSLWLMGETDDGQEEPTVQFTKLADRVGDTLHDYTNKQLLYAVGKDLWSYSLEDPDRCRCTPEHKKLATLIVPPTLLGKRNESLFLKVSDKLYAASYDASNLYELGDAAGASVFLASTSQRIWVLKNNQLSEWLLRENGSNILGRWSGLWFGENYQTEEEPDTSGVIAPTGAG